MSVNLATIPQFQYFVESRTFSFTVMSSDLYPVLYLEIENTAEVSPIVGDKNQVK